MRNVLLIGARASGKTAVGRRAAELLGDGWSFVEMDEALVSRIGMPIAAYFVAHGEAAFREEERALLEEIGRSEGQVVACGGGVAGTPESLAHARAAGSLVWLETPVPDLIARRLADPGENARPALLAKLAELKAADLEAYLHVEVPTILARRQPYYAQAAYVVHTAGLDVDRMAHLIASLARLLEPVQPDLPAGGPSAAKGGLTADDSLWGIVGLGKASPTAVSEDSD